MRSLLTTLALLVSSLSAAVVLTSAEAVWTGGAGAMLAVGHLTLTAVAIVAGLVGAARWSVALSIGLVAVLSGPAVAHPVSPGWIVMVAAGGAALAGLIGGGMRGTVRLRPAAGGPPRSATALALGLLGSPAGIAAVQPGGVDAGDWALVAASWVLAAWYAKTWAGALWTVRFGLPLLTAATFLVVPFPQALVPAGLFAGLLALAWTSGARLAVHPIAEPGRSVRIPAELAPAEVLDAAGLDERGRRKGGR